MRLEFVVTGCGETLVLLETLRFPFDAGRPPFCRLATCASSCRLVARAVRATRPCCAKPPASPSRSTRNRRHPSPRRMLPSGARRVLHRSEAFLRRRSATVVRRRSAASSMSFAHSRYASARRGPSIVRASSRRANRAKSSNAESASELHRRMQSMAKCFQANASRRLSLA